MAVLLSQKPLEYKELTGKQKTHSIEAVPVTREIELNLIKEDPRFQPRTFLSGKEHEDLVANLAANLQDFPMMTDLVVWERGNEGTYILLQGHLRLAALRKNGVNKTICKVFEEEQLSEEQAFVVSGLHNLIQTDYTRFAWGQWFKKLKDEYGYSVKNLEAIAPMKKTLIYESLNFVEKLHPEVQKLFVERNIPAYKALGLMGLPKADQPVAAEMIASDWKKRGVVTLETDKRIGKMFKDAHVPRRRAYVLTIPRTALVPEDSDFGRLFSPLQEEYSEEEVRHAMKELSSRIKAYAAQRARLA